MAYGRKKHTSKRSTGRFIFDELSSFGGLAVREGVGFGELALREVSGGKNPSNRKSRYSRARCSCRH